MMFTRRSCIENDQTQNRYGKAYAACRHQETVDYRCCHLIRFLGAFLVFLCSKYDYKKTYVVSYTEAEHTRIAMAEHIRKLPMSLFNSKDLSELTTNLIGDVATSEHVLSHVVPQMISNFISISVITVMLAFFDWRMALAMFLSVPVSFAMRSPSSMWTSVISEMEKKPFTI